MQVQNMDQKTILIVEDQIDFLAIHKIFLERNGYRVISAENGREGVRCAREHHPNLILMDYSMPELDGVSAIRQLKQDPKTADIPVVLLTAHAYGSVGRRAREVGCAGFLAKPCDPRRVLNEVQQWIGSPAN
jgi:two-component system, cell cycle response regulator DivK